MLLRVTIAVAILVGHPPTQQGPRPSAAHDVGGGFHAFGRVWPRSLAPSGHLRYSCPQFLRGPALLHLQVPLAGNLNPTKSGLLVLRLHCLLVPCSATNKPVVVVVIIARGFNHAPPQRDRCHRELPTNQPRHFCFGPLMVLRRPWSKRNPEQLPWQLFSFHQAPSHRNKKLRAVMAYWCEKGIWLVW